jgi:hypothetical protein
MKFNINCIHEQVCEQLGEKGYCLKKCSSYKFDFDAERYMRKFIEERSDFIIPYDILFGYVQLDNKENRGFMMFGRNGEVIK